MSWTAHSDPEAIKEHETDPQLLDRQATELADLIRNSKHFIAFTGAGVSTSAGIPDFRGPKGVWTLRAQGKSPSYGTSTSKAFPTCTHMSLVALAEAGLLKFLISQNCDGLHRRSGFPVDRLAELHGNSNLDQCSSCSKSYLRDFHSRNNRRVHDHTTGRYCACGGELHDTIINFGENLPEKPLNDGFSHAKRADLCLVLGSSLTVTPACDMPAEVAANGNKLVVCNLQKTKMDPSCALRVFSKTDDLMLLVMQKLAIPIPEWKLKRLVSITRRPSAHNAQTCVITVAGIEPDRTPASIFKKVQVTTDSQHSINAVEEPFQAQLTTIPLKIQVRLHFMGHYHEPPVDLSVDFSDNSSEAACEKTFQLVYSPCACTWDIKEISM